MALFALRYDLRSAPGSAWASRRCTAPHSSSALADRLASAGHALRAPRLARRLPALAAGDGRAIAARTERVRIMISTLVATLYDRCASRRISRCSTT